MIVVTKNIFHEMICFSNKLHVSIFDTIVYHLDKMAGAVLAHPITTRLAIHFSTYSLLKVNPFKLLTIFFKNTESVPSVKALHSLFATEFTDTTLRVE